MRPYRAPIAANGPPRSRNAPRPCPPAFRNTKFHRLSTPGDGSGSACRRLRSARLPRPLGRSKIGLPSGTGVHGALRERVPMHASVAPSTRAPDPATSGLDQNAGELRLAGHPPRAGAGPATDPRQTPAGGRDSAAPRDAWTTPTIRLAVSRAPSTRRSGRCRRCA